MPPRDRYQVVRTHPSHEIVALGHRPRYRAFRRAGGVARREPAPLAGDETAVLQLAAANLAARSGLDPEDLIVSITENGDDDWSFGYGRAQFLTGELT